MKTRKGHLHTMRDDDDNDFRFNMEYHHHEEDGGVIRVTHMQIQPVGSYHMTDESMAESFRNYIEYLEGARCVLFECNVEILHESFA